MLLVISIHIGESKSYKTVTNSFYVKIAFKVFILSHTDGYYVYIETSSRRPNDKARLQSPVVPANAGPKCLRFWYHMYGAHVNTLNVYVRAGVTLGSPVWTKRGTQGNRWIAAAVVISKPTQFTVSVIIESEKNVIWI